MSATNPHNHEDRQAEAMLAWIEGEPDSGLAEKAIARDESLRPRLEAMRGDAEALASLEPAPAPPGLVEAAMRAAEPALEREALLGLAEGEPLIDRPPRPNLPRHSIPFPVGRVLKPLAVAAGVALVGGVSVWAVLKAVEAVRSFEWQQQAPDRPLAMDDARPTPEGNEGGSTNESVPASADEGTGGARLAATDDPPPEPARMDFERAAALAAEGRLVIRVRTFDVARALASMEERGRDATLSPAVPAELAAAITTPAPRPGPRRAAPEPRAVIADRESSELPDPVEMDRPEPIVVEVEPIVRLAVVRPRAGDLAALLASLEGDEHHALRLEEAAEPLLDPAPPPTRETVFWWTLPPEDWGERVRVPIVIEPR